ncbi:MAG: ABC transporter permease [Melioribacteraceae bacterium]|nr:ABC transporter permease [Melioribacteraceae bacterium]MCF8356639.1 ABC transporter permease [Melioribacteraceae bacterium]MCF8396017.1 ABC transporter permease [Melioribacteraceae bacterium]MCF8421048.1 ABC transporter permease [Melioribacteraceae bacterium]
MIGNFFKIWLRSILKQKIYTSVNFISLAVGFTCFIIINLYISYEFSYDKFNTGYENIFRVVKKDYIGTPAQLAPLAVERIPDIKYATRIDLVSKRTPVMFKYKTQMFNENKFIRVDPEFFKIFSTRFIYGDSSTALNNENSLVITSKTADKYFGDENPIGKVLSSEDGKEYVISAVVNGFPENSHFHFDLLARFEKTRFYWGEFNFITYFKAASNANIDILQKQLGEIYKENTNESANPFLVQRLAEIHLNSHIRGELEPNTYKSNIYLYFIVSVLILLIGTINFTNLAVAQYFKRMKEVGLRKVIGASKWQIVNQYISESLLYVVFTLLVSVNFVKLFLPYFNNLIGKQIEFNLAGNFSLSLIIAITAIVVVLISGGYPAVYLSGLNPVSIVKGEVNLKSSNSWLRKTLVIIQFSISIFFIIISLLMSEQLYFIDNADLGFNKEHIINIPTGEKYSGNYATLKSEIKKLPFVEDAAYSNFLLSGNNWNQTCWWEGADESEQHRIRWIPADPDFLHTFGIESLWGNGFTKDRLDGAEYILNESAMKMIGWKDAVGKGFKVINKGSVVGVVKDFHFKSLYSKLEPCVLVNYPNLFSHISIRIQQYNVKNSVEQIRAIWRQFMPDRPFDYYFFDDDYDAIYKSEVKSASIINLAAYFTILISCLGLFALASFMAVQKTKEIAIRKVLGASAPTIFMGLVKNFAIWMFVANLIAWSAAYHFINIWLNDFAYKIDIDVRNFILAGLITLAIAMGAVSYQTIKAATANPVKSLKYE